MSTTPATRGADQRCPDLSHQFHPVHAVDGVWCCDCGLPLVVYGAPPAKFVAAAETARIKFPLPADPFAGIGQ